MYVTLSYMDYVDVDYSMIRIVYGVNQSCLIRSAPFSPTIIAGAFVLPLGIVGILKMT